MSDQSLRDIELEIATRSQEDPLANVYKPHDKQLESHRSRKPITLVLGGNRSGKSWSSVAEALLYCTGRRVYAETPTPPVTVWYVMPSLTMFRRAVIPIIKKLAPRSEIRLTQTGEIMSKSENVIRFKNGSELHFLSADMRQKRLAGAAIDLAIMDETPDEDVFEEIQARVITKFGRILLAFSPTDVQSYWVRDKIYLPWMAGERLDVHVIMMPVADRNGHSLVPHLTDEQIKLMERQWPDPAVRAARIYGEFVTRAGLVFRTFDPEVHVVPAFTVPSNYARWFVVDPEYHRFAALFFAADDAGNYYVTDEYFSQDEQLARRAERMAVLAGKPDRKLPCYVDSANPQDIAELNWHFERLGAPIGAITLPFTKKVEEFVLRIHSLLEPDDERQYPKITTRDALHGAPRLYLFDNLKSIWKWDERIMECSRLIWELQRFVWGKEGKPDKDSADGADCCDALIYGCNIMASGARVLYPEAWKRGLRDIDLILWDAIDRSDRRNRYNSYDR